MSLRRNSGKPAMTDEQYEDLCRRLDSIESEIDFLRNWVTTGIRNIITSVDAYVSGSSDMLMIEWDELLRAHETRSS